ncbi:MAG: hypothetical protein P8Y07_03880, partial [Gemmatimonadales bacterium]
MARQSRTARPAKPRIADAVAASGLVAAAGKKPEEISITGTVFEDLHRGGWDPEARMADQVRDGVHAEVI